MQIVTLLEIVIPRVNRRTFVQYDPSKGATKGFVEISDTEPGTLKQAVIDFALSNGGDENYLGGMREVSGHRYSAPSGVIVFDILEATEHTSPYAHCKPLVALESETRYFMLNEIMNVMSTESG